MEDWRVRPSIVDIQSPVRLGPDECYHFGSDCCCSSWCGQLIAKQDRELQDGIAMFVRFTESARGISIIPCDMPDHLITFLRDIHHGYLSSTRWQWRVTSCRGVCNGRLGSDPSPLTAHCTLPACQHIHIITDRWSRLLPERTTKHAKFGSLQTVEA